MPPCWLLSLALLPSLAGSAALLAACAASSALCSSAALAARSAAGSGAAALLPASVLPAPLIAGAGAGALAELVPQYFVGRLMSTYIGLYCPFCLPWETRCLYLQICVCVCVVSVVGVGCGVWEEKICWRACLCQPPWHSRQSVP